MKNIVLLIAIFGCTKPVIPEDGTLGVGKGSCGVKIEKYALCSDGKCSSTRELSLPAKGKMVLESHLKTDQDPSPLASVTDRIRAHTDRACEILKKVYGVKDCSQVYKTKYHNEWTPAEGGKIGDGSTSLKPSIVEEMFTGNMMWARGNKPKPCEKWLVSYNSKSVVVCMGYETGPGSSSFLGGLQGEVHYFLGSNNSSEITLGRLIDQNLSLGPIECETK